MASIFRRRNKTYTLKEFYESNVTLPVIIYIDQGFAGNNAVETIGAGQYFFIHAVYRQRRAMTRGNIPAVSADKCLISIPLSYPIKFRRVESRLKVGHEDFMWSLLRKFDPPFQVQMSRTDQRRLDTGPCSTTTSEMSNLLVMGKYKEIYLLGNLINQGTGALYYKQVAAIPLYLPDVEISVVDGFAEGINDRWMLYIDKLYAFALQEIDLHVRHGNRDISIFIEDKSTLARSEMCEYLVPDRNLLLQTSEHRQNHTTPNSRQYQPPLRADDPRYNQDPTAGDNSNRKRREDTVKSSQTQTDGDDEVIVAFSRDYTPLDEIRDLKRPVPAPRQRQPVYPTAQPEDISLPPILPPRKENALHVEPKEIETPKYSSSKNLQTDEDERGEEVEEKVEYERKSRTAIPFYDKNRPDTLKKLTNELMQMCERKKESEITSPVIPEPEIDYDFLPPKRLPNSLRERRKDGRETDNEYDGGKYQSSARYVTHQALNDPKTEPGQKMTFDPQMPFDHMTINDVIEVLKMLNLYKYEAAFRSDMIDGFMLSGLTDDHLRDCFGFSVLESKRLMHFILHRHLPKKV